MAHTPGPWIVREPEEDELYEVYAENGGDLICYPVYTRNQRDNIHLIAAAPTMLSTLIGVRAALADLDSGWREMDATDVDQMIAGWLHVVGRAVAQAEGITMEADDGKERSLD